MARALDFRDENRFIMVWIVVIDDFNHLLRYDAYEEIERSRSCSVPWAIPNVRFLGSWGVSRDLLQHGAHKTLLHNTIK